MPAEGFAQAGRVRSGPRVHGATVGAGAAGRSTVGTTGTTGSGSRRSRWDTDDGITHRDVVALRWLGQQYGARSDTLRVLLGRLSPGRTKVPGLLGEETLRDALDRWEQRGLAFRERLFGFTWAFPTAKALRLVGLEQLPVWHPVAPRLEHVHAVGLVRLALEPAIPSGGRWLSERELARERKDGVPDGAIELPDDPDATPGRGLLGEAVDRPAKRIAIEVELTRKSVMRLRTNWSRSMSGRWKRTTYYAPPDVLAYLERQHERIQPKRPIAFMPLPEVPGATYGSCGGVR